MTLLIKRARENELPRLYSHYMRHRRTPFFIDVSGPPPRMKAADFVEYCTENDSVVLLCRSENAIVGCAHYRDRQPGLELANFDLVFFDDIPAPDSKDAAAFATAFRATSKSQKISRVQLLALKDEHAKIALLESIGFRREGVLREHYFFGQTTHDLVMLGWTSEDRSARLAKLADEEDEDDSEDTKSVETIERGKVPKKPVAPEKSGIFSRRVGTDDAELLIRWYGDPLIQETIEDEELPLEGRREKAAMLAALDEFQDGACAFIIEFDGEPVGLAHFMWFDWVSRTAELDYFLAPDLRPGPFLARAVLREIGRIAFEDFHINKMYGFTYATNEKSVSLNAQFMDLEAELKDYLPRKGGGADVVVQGLLASDFHRKFGVRRAVHPSPPAGEGPGVRG